MPADQKCHICSRRTAYERPELRGRVLCDACAEWVRVTSHAASSLSRHLMEWGKHEEWSGLPQSVMLEAMGDRSRYESARRLYWDHNAPALARNIT